MIIVQRLVRIPSHLRLSAITLALTTPLLNSPSFALDYSIDLLLGSEVTDNVDRLGDNQKREGIESYIGSDIGLTHNSEALNFAANYHLIYRDFKNGTLETNEEINGNSELLWEIIDSRLSWHINHDISEVLSNDLVADTVDNRETRQILSTGPTYTARMSAVDNIILSLDYTQLTQDNAFNEGPADRSDIDSERAQADIIWSHSLSSTSTLEVGYSHAETEFDNNSPDFNYQQLFAGYHTELASGNYGIRLGANRVERDLIDADQTGVFTAINYNRNFSSNIFSVDIVRQLADSSLGLESDIDSLNTNSFDEIAVVERTRLDVSYEFQNLCRGCIAQLTYTYDNSDFENDELVLSTDSTQDNKDNRISANLTYNINSRLSTRLLTSYLQTDFSAFDRKDRITEVESQTDWQLSAKLALNFSLAYINRDTKNSPLGDIDYNASTIGISATYTIK
ncbi:hypothetical protein N9F42_01945 [Pseudomonadales bacterium]|nr:hypothetical protein [Pseudomonadales bacterium]